MSASPASAALAAIDMARNGQFAELRERFAPSLQPILSRWKAALGGRPDVTIRVYDADNHLFFPGSGPSSPEEYEPAQHVDPEVIADVASWLRPG